MKRYLFFIGLILVFIYYQFYYNRYFIYNKDGTKVITIWKVQNYHTYIISGKYYSPFEPKSNYIYTTNQGISVLFNTKDSCDYKLSVFYKEISPDFNPKVGIYKNNDSLLLEYGILEKISEDRSKRIYHKNEDSLIQYLDYKYIDLKRVYGIKVFD